jgi:hypothetical protein
MPMKVLLTVEFDGDREEFVKAMQAELAELVSRGDAQRTALDVRADGDELDAVRELDTEHGAAAMVSRSRRTRSPCRSRTGSWSARTR